MKKGTVSGPFTINIRHSEQGPPGVDEWGEGSPYSAASILNT